MYKKASQAQQRIHRTGSHATMPSATGRIDLMPAWAVEPEEYYNTLREQFAHLVDYLAVLRERIAPYTDMLKRPMLKDEYEDAREIHDEYGQMMAMIERQMEALRPLVRNADQCSRDALAWHLAKNHLTMGEIPAIEKAVVELIRDWRPRNTLPRAHSELVGIQHDKESRRNQQRRKRTISRNTREFWGGGQQANKARQEAHTELVRREKEQKHRRSEVAIANRQMPRPQLPLPEKPPSRPVLTPRAIPRPLPPPPPPRPQVDMRAKLEALQRHFGK
jgi:hypothetical protein